MANVPSAENIVSVADFDSLSITPIAHSMVSEYLDEDAIIYVRETSTAFNGGYTWETMYVTIKRTNGEVVEAVFCRDGSVDWVYALESIDIIA
jgi:hypothetical protein